MTWNYLLSLFQMLYNIYFQNSLNPNKKNLMLVDAKHSMYGLFTYMYPRKNALKKRSWQ